MRLCSQWIRKENDKVYFSLNDLCTDLSTPAAAPSRLQAKPLDEEDDCEEEDPRDSIAETLIRWVPPITAIVCAGIALCGFVYSQFMM